MSQDKVKLPRNDRYRTQSQAFALIAQIDADIAEALIPFVDTKEAANWDADCAIVAVRVWDATTPALIEVHNDDIQAGRGCEVAQRKRISAAVGSSIVAEWCKAGKGCKSADTIKKMMAKRDITSMHSLRKELARIAKSEKAEKTEADILAELVEANESARSQLGILDPHGVDGLQGLFDKMRKLIQECESVPTEDAPILEAAILAGFNKVTAAAEKREIAIEKAEAKAERQAKKKAA
jgi:hypothetical protein